MTFHAGQRVCWTDRNGADHNGVYVDVDGHWSIISVGAPSTDADDDTRTVLTSRLRVYSEPAEPVEAPESEADQPIQGHRKYTFYVRLMEKTRQVLPESLITVEAVSELHGRFRATRKYAEQHGISVWISGLVAETTAQREHRDRSVAGVDSETCRG